MLVLTATVPLPPSADPLVWGALVYRGKRRLRPLPRGAEDAVIGYWRFERGEDEVVLERSRVAELRKAGKLPATGAVKLEALEGGVWGTGSASGEAISPFPAAVADLSKQRLDGHLLDALVMLARGKKDIASLAAKYPLPAGVRPVGFSPLAPYVRAGYGTTYDGPCEAGDPVKVREPRALVCGLHVVPYVPPATAAGDEEGAGGAGTPSPAASKASPAITVPDKVALIPMTGAPPTTELGSAGTGLPVSTISLVDRLLTAVAAWGFAVPVPRFSVSDVGVRPFDPVNAIWTLEAWVKPGYPYVGAAPGTEVVRGGNEDAFGGDDGDGMGSGGAGAGGRGGGGGRVNASMRVGRDLIVAARAERFPRTLSPAAPLSTSNDVGVRMQWTLAVRGDGAVAFTAFPFGECSGDGRGGGMCGSGCHMAAIQSRAPGEPVALASRGATHARQHSRSGTQHAPRQRAHGPVPIPRPWQKGRVVVVSLSPFPAPSPLYCSWWSVHAGSRRCSAGTSHHFVRRHAARHRAARGLGAHRRRGGRHGCGKRGGIATESRRRCRGCRCTASSSQEIAATCRVANVTRRRSPA